MLYLIASRRASAKRGSEVKACARCAPRTVPPMTGQAA